MQIIDLFSGIGGFSLAGHWIGWETIQFCEINPFCRKILDYHFKGVPIHDDIKTLDYEKIKKRIDPDRSTIVVGGFPCQPYSAAGKRKGKEDDRHLWPYCLETVKQLRPNYCVFENVLGLVNWNGGMVFDEVQADLEAEGYEVQAYVLPACAVNAPHRRDRVWFVSRLITNSSGSRCHRDKEFTKRFFSKRNGFSRNESDSLYGAESIADTTSINRNEGRESEVNYKRRKDNESIGEGGELRNTTGSTGNSRITSNSCKEQLQRGEFNRGFKKERPIKEESRQFSRSISSTWQNFPTQSPVCNGNDGFSTELVRQRIQEDSMGCLSEKEIDKIISEATNKWRNETIKAGGNAIVPQVVYQIFKSIEQYEKSWQK